QGATAHVQVRPRLRRIVRVGIECEGGAGARICGAAAQGDVTSRDSVLRRERLFAGQVRTQDPLRSAKGGLMSALDVRVAREDDLERLVEIHSCAYPEPGGYQRHARHVTRNAFGGLECLRVAEKDGVVVAFAALGRLDLWLGGRPVPTGGIASLAVAPESR